LRREPALETGGCGSLEARDRVLGYRCQRARLEAWLGRETAEPGAGEGWLRLRSGLLLLREPGHGLLLRLLLCLLLLLLRKGVRLKPGWLCHEAV
jgi:hypothetical protein